MRASEVVEIMDQKGMNVIAHLLHNNVHEYNLPRGKIEKLTGDITVLKWERDEGVSNRKKKSFKKNALYQLSK